MRKTSLLALSVLSAVLLSSAFFSLAAAQEQSDGTEPASSPDVSPVPELPVDPDAADKADESGIVPRDVNATDPDVPVTDDNAVLYTTQDDGNSLIAPAPGAEDANLESAQNSPDYTLYLAIIGVILAVIVGGAIGVVHYRNKVAKTET